MSQIAAIKPVTLTLLIVLLSAAVGYMAALQRHVGLMVTNTPVITPQPQLGAAEPDVSGSIHRDVYPSTSDWGKLNAQMLKLHVLLRRIVELGDFDGGEFDADLKRFNQSSLMNKTPILAVSAPAAERFDLAKQQLNHMSDTAAILLSIADQREYEKKQLVSGRPVSGGWLSSRFGYRKDPVTGRRHYHRGLDFAGKRGTPIFALADGVVTYSGVNGGYGNLVELEHADGYVSRYAHNSSNLVPVGQRVNKGQTIALMGSTGKSTGTHLHLEVRKGGQAVDPMPYINR